MRTLFHAQLIRGLFATGCAALGVATWDCSSTGPETEPTGTKDSEFLRWPPPPPPASVLTQHNDNARSGANLNERMLTPSNVAKSFGYLYDLPVEGVVYAQPLVAANVTINGTLYRSVVYVVTMHNMVYAFDGSASTPTLLMSRQLETPNAGQDPVIGHCGAPWFTSSFGNWAAYSCYGTQRPTVSNIPGEIGILSTPVIVGGTMYLITNTGAGTSNQHILHALNLGTFADVATPQVATFPDGSTFPSYMAIQRPALLAANGTIYAAFASYCDAAPYMGRVLGFDASTLKVTSQWESDPEGALDVTRGSGGIWQSGQGPSADSSGNVYLSTGNGNVDADDSIAFGGKDAADAIVKLSPPPVGSTEMQIADWFLPSNWQSLNAGDTDLGSAGVLLINDFSLVLGGGKSSTLYVGTTSNLGHMSASVQTFGLNSGPIKGTPVYWKGPNGPQVNVWASGDVLKTLLYNGSSFQQTATTSNTAADPGAMLSVSANGSANGVLWAARSTPGSDISVFCPRQGDLVAFDASNATSPLWDSNYEVSAPGFVFSKNAPPTIANGRVFVSTFGPQSNIGQQPPTQGMVRVFGLGAPARGFGPSVPWSQTNFWGTISPSILSNPTQLADVTGDGRADAVAFDGTSVWVMVANSTGNGFGPPTPWSSSLFYGEHDTFSTMLGDVTGDGKADAVAFDGTSAWVLVSNGSGFGPPTPWSNYTFYGTLASSTLANPTQLADVTGDGKADAVAFDGSSVWVMASNGAGTGFLPPAAWSNSLFYGEHDTFSTMLGDVTGDGKADAVAFDGTSAWVLVSNGSGFGPPMPWSNAPFYGTLPSSTLGNPTQLGDVNGDGKADAVAFDGGQTWVMLSTGAGFEWPTLWSNTNFYGYQNRFSTWLGDVDGDGLADAVAFDGASTWVMLGVR